MAGRGNRRLGIVLSRSWTDKSRSGSVSEPGFSHDKKWYGMGNPDAPCLDEYVSAGAEFSVRLGAHEAT